MSSTQQRMAMVDRQILARGVSDEHVIKALEKVPRHLFMPEQSRSEAYSDHPVQIGEGQTISQPYIVAYMTEQLRIGPNSRVLEVGLGSGYQAAVLAEIAESVFSVEIIPFLAKRAQSLLSELGYDNVYCKIGNGYEGWPEKAPFDGIIVTAAPPEVPERLLKQLAPGGVMVLPVGEGVQELVKIVRKGPAWETERLMPVRFVPMVKEVVEQESDR